MKVYCFTSDREMWALRPFTHFMTCYWKGAEVEVVGFSPPPFSIPYPFHSIGTMADYPYSKWSDGIIDFLNTVNTELFVFTLEDFWPTRPVDVEAIAMLEDFMRHNPIVARCDLTTDRLGGAGVVDVLSWGRLDIIQNIPPAAYHLSFQPGIWRRTELLKYLIRGENPHEVELRGTERMIAGGAIVVGTRNFPLRILIAVQNGKLKIDGSGYQVPHPLLNTDDVSIISAWIPPDHL